MIKRKKASPARRARPEFSPEELVSLERQVIDQKKSELSWLNMTALPSEEEDRWSNVEEHLLAKPTRDHAQRRWKYFSK